MKSVWEQTGLDEVSLEGRRRVALVAARLLPHRRADREVDVLPDEVGELERPHREAALLAERPVDGGRVGDAALDDALRLSVEGSSDAVDDEARGRAAPHRGLAPGRHERGDVLDVGPGGARAVHDLDELHDGRWVEEVQPEHALGVGDVGGDVVDVDARRVGREHRRRRLAVGEVGEDPTLEVEVLGHGLDDETALGQLVERLDGGDPGQHRGRVVGGEPSLVDEARQGGADLLDGACRRARHRVDEGHVVAGVRRDLGDAGPHGSCPDDSDGAERRLVRMVFSGLGGVRVHARHPAASPAPCARRAVAGRA